VRVTWFQRPTNGNRTAGDRSSVLDESALTAAVQQRTRGFSHEGAPEAGLLPNPE